MDKPTPKTVKVTVNGKSVEVDANSSVIQATEKAGVFVPRYCYHEDLSIAGVCRMCVVEIEKNPRLQISCNTQVADGMVVSTDSPRVKEAVKSALELHLINHPLDCPICDKAGECKLQDFYQDFGQYKSRMPYDEKVHKPKVQDIGTIVLDSERCILCTRCVRFTNEVTHSHEFGIFNRGDRSELRTYDHGPLRNEYTGNLADICPVGALTAKDFRFQCRVWFLEKTTSVCAMCARGCNTTVSVNPATKTLYRVEPRRNPEVNSSWICDHGRWEYHHVYDDKRIKFPRTNVAGNGVEATWHHAFQGMNDQLGENAGKILVGLSTQLTNEEIADTVLTLRNKGVSHFTWLVDEAVVDERKPYDGILKHHDLTANAAGFKWVMNALGIPWVPLSQAKSLVQKGNFTAVWLIGVEGHPVPWVGDLVKEIPASTKLLVHATSETPFWETAEWVLPNVTAYEKSGTVINALAHLQKLQAGLPPQHTARNAHALAFGVAQGHDRQQQPLGRAQAIFEKLAEKISKTVKWRGFPTAGIRLSLEEGASGQG
jgi:NADH-quinone oxidoreductase subunit G